MEKPVQRPPSIVAFDRLYLSSVVLYLLNAVLFWTATRAIMLTSLPAANPAVARLLPTIMAGSLVVTVAVSLLLWWLVVRARNVAGKWLVAATEAIGAVLAALALVRLAGGASINTPSVLLGLISTALAIAAAAMLFRPDAVAWFATDRPDLRA